MANSFYFVICLFEQPFFVRERFGNCFELFHSCLACGSFRGAILMGQLLQPRFIFSDDTIPGLQ